MYVITKQWKNIKPPVGSQLNFSHPLSQGLVGCWLMNEGGGNKVKNIVNLSNGIGTIFLPTWKPRNKGISVSIGTNQYIQAKDNVKGLVNTCTIVCSIFINSWLDANNGIWEISDGTTGERIAFYADNAAGDNLYLFNPDGSNYWNFRPVRTTFPGGNSYTTAVILRSVGLSSVYINGKLVIPNIGNANGAIQNNLDTILLGAFGGATPANFMSGGYYYFYFYNRALSPSEIQALYEAPYQMVQPIRTRFYSIAASGDTSTPIAIGGFRRNFLTLGCG